MAKLNWNQQAITSLANEAAATVAERVQALLDDVRSTSTGADVEAVRARLRSRWQSEFGRTPSDAYLDDWAGRLAAGARVIVRVGTTNR